MTALAARENPGVGKLSRHTFYYTFTVASIYFQ